MGLHLRETSCTVVGNNRCSFSVGVGRSVASWSVTPSWLGLVILSRVDFEKRLSKVRERDKKKERGSEIQFRAFGALDELIHQNVHHTEENVN